MLLSYLEKQDISCGLNEAAVMLPKTSQIRIYFTVLYCQSTRPDPLDPSFVFELPIIAYCLLECEYLVAHFLIMKAS